MQGWILENMLASCLNIMLHQESYSATKFANMDCREYLSQFWYMYSCEFNEILQNAKEHKLHNS